MTRLATNAIVPIGPPRPGFSQRNSALRLADVSPRTSKLRSGDGRSRWGSGRGNSSGRGSGCGTFPRGPVPAGEQGRADRPARDESYSSRYRVRPTGPHHGSPASPRPRSGPLRTLRVASHPLASSVHLGSGPPGGVGGRQPGLRTAKGVKGRQAPRSGPRRGASFRWKAGPSRFDAGPRYRQAIEPCPPGHRSRA